MHGLGLLMVEALLAPEGAQCISLGVQTPLEDVRRAALAHRVDLVALSFSAAFPVRRATEGLAALRRQLPQSVTVWAGGAMTRRVRGVPPGVILIPDLAAAIDALRGWRGRAAPRTGPRDEGRSDPAPAARATSALAPVPGPLHSLESDDRDR
jgi:hypothetical protein